ncbi:MAG: hypothetical protein CVV41_00250 [Candidatus Riflebacteria bacterium HGW-Riflebacteria-1]|jgi:flagellar motor component MotA|nr:MAG: hypothetical protein CVV41_00250 [Candidatus Riflebacteria bacterium HGW-Riflebacteria-1]
MTKINLLGVFIWVATLAVMTNISDMNSFGFINIPAALWVGLGVAGALLVSYLPQQSRGERYKAAAHGAWYAGIISFAVGLVTVLNYLDDPAAIGPNIAVALLSILYGSVISLVCHSLALRHEKAAE